jgi:hypothetical protein
VLSTLLVAYATVALLICGTTAQPAEKIGAGFLMW